MSVDEVQPVPEQPMLGLAPLEILFSDSRILIEDGESADGPVKKLILIHPCGIAAVAILPEEAAKQIGGRLMGSGKIVTATHMPPAPPA